MDVTVSGITTSFNLPLFINALLLIEVTSFPSIISGILNEVKAEASNVNSFNANDPSLLGTNSQ